jgi:hypothetical protein
VVLMAVELMIPSPVLRTTTAQVIYMDVHLVNFALRTQLSDQDSAKGRQNSRRSPW